MRDALWHRVQEQRRLHQQASVDREARERAAGGKVQSKRARDRQKLALLLRHYWHRLAGAALGWFASDFYYCALLVAPWSQRLTSFLSYEVA